MPRTAQLASRAPQAGHSIVRIRSKMAPIQSTPSRTAHPTPPRRSLGRTAVERACQTILTSARGCVVSRKGADQCTAHARLGHKLMPDVLHALAVGPVAFAAPPRKE